MPDRLCALVLLFCSACTSTSTNPDGGAGMGGNAGTAADSGVCTYNPLVSPTNCPNDAPADCPADVPSYRSSVAPTIAAHCQPCHRAGGMVPDKPFATYADVYKYRRTALVRVKGCVMPPVCASQPTAEQRSALLQWLVCGAPDN